MDQTVGKSRTSTKSRDTGQPANMKALGLVVSEKKIFESFILKTYLLTL